MNERTKKIVVIVLTVAMNVCGAIVAQHLFTDGSTAQKTVTVLGGIVANGLALLGVPVLEPAGMGSKQQVLSDKAGEIDANKNDARDPRSI